MMKRIFTLLSFAFLLGSLPLHAKVITYPAPIGEDLSLDYTIEVNGLAVPAYLAKTQHYDKKYSIAYFDFSGSVTVTIKSQFPLTHLAILPDRYGIDAQVDGNVATFTLDSLVDISFESAGYNSPLLLFTNPY